LNYLIISFALMLNINFLIKKSNKILLSTNKLIESFFNRLKILIDFKKKKKINLKQIDNKITLGVGLIVILFISYFLIPTVYDKNLVKIELEKQILKKYNLEVKFEDDISYRLLPKPHFFSGKITIKHNNSVIAESNNSRIFITIKNFFSSKELKIKNLFFKKTEFNIDSNNANFFKQILNSNKSNHNLKFKNSILFYKNEVKDVVLIVDLDNLNFFYNDELDQQLNANYKIFNIPFDLIVKNDPKKKEIFSKIKSHKIRLNINNDFDYKNENINGLLEFKIINKSKLFEYQIIDNSLNFNSKDKNFDGNLSFRPFYLKSNLEFNSLDIKKLFKDNSILLNLLNSEILNNQNLNAQIDINFDKIKDANYLKNIVFKMYFEEGNIIIKSSSIDWNNSISIDLNETQLINEKNKLTLVGALTFNFTDIDKFYSFYQVKRNYRKEIKKIKFDFLLNLSEKEIQFDNLKIDGVSSRKVDNFLNKLNFQKINIFNNVYFKNLIKQFFANYHEG
jgi:hypothetical protein